MAENKVFTIQGIEFTAPFKYAEGHTLSAIEAKVLNQTRFENLRNNFAKTVKDSLAGVDGAVPQSDLQKVFAEYESNYDFAAPGAGASRTLDPIEKEAKSLATEIVRNAFKANGRSWNAPKDASDEAKAAFTEARDNKVAEIAAREEVVAQARKNVAARQKSLAAISEGLNL